VSNLPYLSKLLETVVKTRLQEFLDEHDLMQPHQSAYRKFHSTETALLHLYNDLLVASVQGRPVARGGCDGCVRTPPLGQKGPLC